MQLFTIIKKFWRFCFTFTFYFAYIKPLRKLEKDENYNKIISNLDKKDLNLECEEFLKKVSAGFDLNGVYSEIDLKSFKLNLSYHCIIILYKILADERNLENIIHFELETKREAFQINRLTSQTITPNKYISILASQSQIHTEKNKHNSNFTI